MTLMTTSGVCSASCLRTIALQANKRERVSARQVYQVEPIASNSVLPSLASTLRPNVAHTLMGTDAKLKKEVLHNWDCHQSYIDGLALSDGCSATAAR
jgi:hypothetical protein